MLNAVSCGGELPFDRAGKPRCLSAGSLTAEGSLGVILNRSVLAHST